METVVTGAEREEEAAELTETETPKLLNCQRVVDLLRAAFGKGRLAEESTWKAVALILKGGG